jgi:hypothetical protein
VLGPGLARTAQLPAILLEEAGLVSLGGNAGVAWSKPSVPETWYQAAAAKNSAWLRRMSDAPARYDRVGTESGSISPPIRPPMFQESLKSAGRSAEIRTPDPCFWNERAKYGLVPMAWCRRYALSEVPL